MKDYAIIGIVLSICYTINGYKIKVNDDFFCDSDNSTKYYILGLPFSCPANWNCNLGYSKNKEFCTDDSTEDLCKKIFECSSSNQVIVVGSVELNCDKYYECNADHHWPCQPCIPKKCNDATFECSPDLTSFKYPNMQQIPCEKGYVCNVDKICPAEPCIKLNDISDPPEESTPPQESTTPQEEENCGVPEILDCNDGYGTSDPCRRAPKESNVYFKCYKSTLWYDYKILKCADLQKDLKCKDVKCLCK